MTRQGGIDKDAAVARGKQHEGRRGIQSQTMAERDKGMGQGAGERAWGNARDGGGDSDVTKGIQFKVWLRVAKQKCFETT